MSNKNSNNIKGRMDQILHPIPAILYLAKDRSCSPPHRYSKIQALADLVEHEFRCRQEEEKVSLNLSHLAKRWNWARPTVISYANTLHEMGGLPVGRFQASKKVFCKSCNLPLGGLVRRFAQCDNGGSSRSSSSNESENKKTK